jgi:Protein of unknown function (DUF3800)
VQVPKKVRSFVHLAYLDDSDTKSKSAKWQVMAGVLIPDISFKLLEIVMGEIQNIVLPEERLGRFEEFHACELYGGYGVFEGIDQELRFRAIKQLLGLCSGKRPFPIVYGAVNLDQLKGAVFASADPLDMTFRMCTDGIATWVARRVYKRSGLHCSDEDSYREIEKIAKDESKYPIEILVEELVMLIADDCDKKIKETLYKSFRAHRRRIRMPKIDGSVIGSELFHFHDDMYFSDSRYSIGIQLADLCAYFIARHLERDSAIEGFYKLIEPNIVSAQTYPENVVEHSMPSVIKEELLDGK